MLKQWLLSDGKVDDITVEERYTRWTEQLRSDRYVTVPDLALPSIHVTCDCKAVSLAQYNLGCTDLLPSTTEAQRPRSRNYNSTKPTERVQQPKSS